MKHYFTLTFLLIFSFTVHAQNAIKNIITADSAIAKFRNDYPQEKIFLQSDKSQYLAGETVWMKAWCSADAMPTYLSRLLYIDIVNSTGKVVLKKMYRLDAAGSTPADLDLPKELTSGNYSINAYTLWMQNFPEFIYRKNIYIYNVDYFKTVKPKASKAILLVNFFPEGGDLIAGTKNRIAFKATDANGFPVDIKGSITDNAGNKIADLITEHDGLGSFEIETVLGQSYMANINASNGSTLQYKLPALKEEGIAMRVENTNPNRLFVLLDRAEKNKARYNKVQVLVQINYQVIVNAQLNFDQGLTAVPVSKKNLPAGIIQITVFDENGFPLNERIAFIENYVLNKPIIFLDTLGTKSKQKNVFSFSLDGIKDANLSTLITNADLDNGLYETDNIASSILVTADIKGYIHQPGYYFKNKDAITLHHLDLLLMTQGWRRFDWKKIMANDFAALKYPVESAITFQGKLKKSDRAAIIKEGHVAFVIKGEDSTSIMADARVTDKGEFLVNNLNFTKAATIAYQGTDNKNENYIVDVDLYPSFIDSLKTSNNKSFINLDTSDLSARKNALANYLYGKVALIDTGSFNGFNYLGNVNVKAVRKKLSLEDSLNNKYATGIFQLGKSIAPQENSFVSTIWQLIQRSVPGIDISGNPFSPVVKFSRFAGLDGMSENNSASYLSASGSSDQDFGTMLNERNGVAYYLNEVNVSMDVISNINVNDVALIKILKTEAAALGATGGVIAIYTNKDIAIRNAAYEKAFNKEKRLGYAVIKSFYSPDYTTAPTSGLVDKRFTLFWNPTIKLGKDGKYHIKFFNSDNSTKFKLIIQGIDKEGRLIHHEQIIQ